jgi:hypothetical protein
MCRQDNGSGLRKCAARIGAEVVPNARGTRGYAISVMRGRWDMRVGDLIDYHHGEGIGVIVYKHDCKRDDCGPCDHWFVRWISAKPDLYYSHNLTHVGKPDIEADYVVSESISEVICHAS